MKKTVLLLFLISLYSFNVHKYYISLTEIEYKKETNTIQMITNVFIDDIETAINQQHQVNLQLTTKEEHQKVDDYFFNYLKEHLKIKIDHKKVNFNFIGKEYDGNIVYFYLEIPNINKVKTLEIQNDILTKYFPEQQNPVKAKINGKRKSLFLSKKNDKGLLKF